jgi:hypothetical protein
MTSRSLTLRGGGWCGGVCPRGWMG